MGSKSNGRLEESDHALASTAFLESLCNQLEANVTAGLSLMLFRCWGHAWNLTNVWLCGLQKVCLYCKY